MNHSLKISWCFIHKVDHKIHFSWKCQGSDSVSVGTDACLKITFISVSRYLTREKSWTSSKRAEPLWRWLVAMLAFNNPVLKGNWLFLWWKSILNSYTTGSRLVTSLETAGKATFTVNSPSKQSVSGVPILVGVALKQGWAKYSSKAACCTVSHLWKNNDAITLLLVLAHLQIMCHPRMSH